MRMMIMPTTTMMTGGKIISWYLTKIRILTKWISNWCQNDQVFKTLKDLIRADKFIRYSQSYSPVQKTMRKERCLVWTQHRRWPRRVKLCMMGCPRFHAISISFQLLTRLCVCVSSRVLEVYDMARKYKRKKPRRRKAYLACNATHRKESENKDKGK